MLKALLFDLDGVIVDTERHGHRVAFNQAFHELGYGSVNWDEELYHRLLQVGGGKERVRYYFERFHQGPGPEDMDAFVQRMHRLKTDIFVKMLPGLPLRPGVRRVMAEVRDRGVGLGICTTSNERVAATVVKRILPEMPFAVIVAGDMVRRKKPDPEIYLKALDKLGIRPCEAVVAEDSHIGVSAASAAGCRVLATYNGYTEGEDLSRADTAVDCLGEPEGPHCHVRQARTPLTKGWVDFSYLAAMG